MSLPDCELGHSELEIRTVAFRPSRVGDRTDSYSRLWQDGAKLAFDLTSYVAGHSPAESGLSGGASLGQARQRIYRFGQSRFLNGSANLDSCGPERASAARL